MGFARNGAAGAPMFSAAAFRGFELLFRPWQARHLRRSPIIGLPDTHSDALPADTPLVLVANHTSWWDGFLLRDVQLALRPRAPMYTVMTQRELTRFPFLRLLGGTGLDTESRTGVRSMLRNLADAVQKQPDAVVVYFPQGRIRPSWVRPLEFRNGIELLLRSIGPCTVLPVALHIEPLNAVAATSFIAAAPPIPSADGAVTAAQLESVITARLDSLHRHLGRFGEDAVAHLGEIE
jgi:1-acyl-sn-glycerol-3-phosphate acyltransferase